LGVVCDNYDEVSILFAKICDFATYTNKLSAVDIVGLLNIIYSHFDEIIDRHGVYKVSGI
jgi:class 3 adenylate cyclase